MAATIYLADTSVLVVRNQRPEIRQRIESLAGQGRLAVCQMSVLEYLNKAASPASYELIWDQIQRQRWMDVTTEALNRALDVHRMLGATSQHREYSLHDLIIAATAEQHGATVLHYDADYDRIAAVTGQPMEWVAPKGSL